MHAVGMLLCSRLWKACERLRQQNRYRKWKPCCSLQKNCERCFIFQQENNPKQSPKLNRNVFKTTIDTVQRPNLNPIRNMWRDLKIAVHSQSKHNTAWTIDECGCPDVQTWHRQQLEALIAVIKKCLSHLYFKWWVLIECCSIYWKSVWIILWTPFPDDQKKVNYICIQHYKIKTKVGVGVLVCIAYRANLNTSLVKRFRQFPASHTWLITAYNPSTLFYILPSVQSILNTHQCANSPFQVWNHFYSLGKATISHLILLTYWRKKKKKKTGLWLLQIITTTSKCVKNKRRNQSKCDFSDLFVQ